MITHELDQGSQEWLKFRLEHDGASEVAAVMGLSKNTTRNELLRIKSTGITKEFSDYVQRMVLDKGHEVEALARPIVEEIIGEDLYPIVASFGERMSASCDGLTMMEDVGWENKQYNETYYNLVLSGEVPEEHMPQVQQCLLVTGAEKWFFTVSDGTPERTAGVWVYPDQEWFNKIISAWDQFNQDLVNYALVDHPDKPVPDAIKELPALFIQAKGEITTNNMKDYGNALTERLSEVRAIVLIEDKDFANANKAAKDFREQIEKLKLVKSAMLEQTTTIGEAARMIDDWCEDLRVTALQLEKDVKREDLAKKEKIVGGGKLAYSEHLQALSAGIKPIELVIADKPDFASAISRKRDYNSMQNGVDTLLANSKIAADAIAKDILAKIDWCKESSAGFGFLFNDLQQIIYKPEDDFKLVVTSRIEAHKKAEEEKQEAERRRIQAEEEAKAKAKAEAEQQSKLDAEREQIRKEEQAKARLQAEEKLRAEQTEKDRANQESKRTQVVPSIDIAELAKALEIDAAIKQSRACKLDADEPVKEKSHNQEKPVKSGNFPVEMVTIPKPEYENLLSRSEWLACLEDAGVDNWIGIDHAKEMLEELQAA